jgi:hypothetical protein
MRRNFRIFVLISLLSLLFPTLSWGDQVSGQRVSGQRVSGAPLRVKPVGGSYELDVEKFTKCAMKNKKKLEKLARKDIPKEVLTNTLVDNIISAFAGGKVGRLVVATAVKHEVMGVVPESSKDMGEAVLDIMTSCVRDSKKKEKNGILGFKFGGKKVNGEKVGGQPVSGADASKWGFK